MRERPRAHQRYGIRWSCGCWVCAPVFVLFVVVKYSYQIVYQVIRIGSYYLAAARFMPEATPTKIVDPQSKKLRVLEADPDRVARELEPIITNEEAATEAMGRAAYREVAQVYARAAAEVKERGDARYAQASNNGTSLLKRSGGVSSVVATAKALADRK